MTQLIFLRSRTDEFNNMPLQDTLRWIEVISGQLANEVDFLKQFQGEYQEEINELLSEETISRFKSVAAALSAPYMTYRSYGNPEIQAVREQGLLVQSWSSLGSLLESTLQMFLAFYYRDYIQSEWYKWDESAIDQILAELNGDFKAALDAVVAKNTQDGTSGLTSRIKKSFLEKANEILKDKRDLPKIEKITLADLIGFYFKHKVVHSNQYGEGELRKIQSYRNAIHAFQKRSIGSWEELNEHAKVLIMLTINMLYQLPEMPSEVPYPEWYYQNKSTIVMQENQWFDYRIGVNFNGDK